MLRLPIIFPNLLQLVFLKLKVGSSILVLILTILMCLMKDLITDTIRSRFSLAIEKDVGFSGHYISFKEGTTLEKNWLNVSQSFSSLDIVLSSSTRLIFSPLDEFWVNNGLPETSVISNFVSVKVFKIRFFRAF